MVVGDETPSIRATALTLISFSPQSSCSTSWSRALSSGVAARAFVRAKLAADAELLAQVGAIRGLNGILMLERVR
jgi:hypothetical protein